jgi:uncharacterized protein (TIGR02246 family)
MKYFFFILIATATIFASCEKNDASNPENRVGATTAGVQNEAATEQEVRNKLDEWIKAIMQQDRAALNRLATDDHMYTGFDGSTFSKAANIESLTNPMFHIGTIETEDVKVKTYDNAAIVTGKALLKMTAESGSSESATRFTQTWVRRNGEWQLAAEHTSQIPQDAGKH